MSICLKCLKKFTSQSLFNRLCDKCNTQNLGASQRAVSDADGGWCEDFKKNLEGNIYHQGPEQI